MGRVVTTNSATLVNKGLEVIEAHLLFDVAYDDIDVVVHPQSIVHSMVEFIDGSTIAQASPPDMRLPISLGLDWPHRVGGRRASARLDDRVVVDLRAARRRTRSPRSRSPSAVGRAGGTYPAVYNAANEQAVDAFHEGRLAVPRHRRHDRSASSTRTSRRPRSRVESLAEAEALGARMPRTA